MEKKNSVEKGKENRNVYTGGTNLNEISNKMERCLNKILKIEMIFRFIGLNDYFILVIRLF